MPIIRNSHFASVVGSPRRLGIQGDGCQDLDGLVMK